MSKNKFLRMCVGCRKSFKKQNLLRISKNKKREISFEKEGRGVYICKSLNCFKLALKRKKDAFSFNLGEKVDENFLTEIKKEIEKSKT